MLAHPSTDRRNKIESRAAALIAEEMSLRDLRRAMGQTQVAVAEKRGLNQENVSRVEQRADVLLSTLNSYVRALGGQLRLVAEFEGRPPGCRQRTAIRPAPRRPRGRRRLARLV
jgi:hypothetical protein